MRRTPFLIALAIAVCPGYPRAHAQARGPVVAEIRENGQEIISRREERMQTLELEQRLEQELDALDRERMHDPVLRAAKIAELETWLRRLVGRFRVDGRISQPGLQTAGDSGTPGSAHQVPVVFEGDIRGIADCGSVGSGVGVYCLINVTWDDVDQEVSSSWRANLPQNQLLDTFKPAVLVLGISLDPPGIRAQMVNADSLSHVWVGRLNGSVAATRRENWCLQGRCIVGMEVSAEPGDAVSMVFRSGTVITMYWHPDADIRAEQPLKPLKAN